MSTRVARDDHGIPQLWADTVDELAYLQGHNAATDRAWQLELDRWRAHGRLAQRLGPDGVAWDRFARRVRLAAAARRCFARLEPEPRRWLSAYVDGVNAGLRYGAAGAPEFAATGTRAGRWRPWDPIGVFLLAHILFGSFANKLWRAHVTATLGPAAVDLFHTGQSSSGSNAWAVTGEHTRHGKPIIAGDPHRLLELPGVYQQVRLSCPEFDVIGLAFPGVPGLPHFGHAGPVAWAITNAMADYQDLYRERLRRDGDRVLVREPSGWQRVPTRRERIRVRGGADQYVEVIETPRGPVIDTDRRTGEALSLRTPSLADHDLGFAALLPLLRARRTSDVEAALRRWVEPVNSVLVADATGTVRWLVAGRVPVRDQACRRLPVPGWEPEYAWRGYAPMPSGDVAGWRVNANNHRAGDTAELGTDFAAPHRAERIEHLLATGSAPAAVHTDTRLGSQRLFDLLQRVDPAGLAPAAAELRRRLLAWDRRMVAESTDAGRFAAWRAALVRRLSEHPYLAPLSTPHGFDEVFAPWLEPVTRIGLAVEAVVAGLPQLGGDPVPAAATALSEVAHQGTDTAWGRRHVLEPVRVPLGEVNDPALAALPEPVPLSGDSGCVLATSSLPGRTDTCARGPVARYVWDLADRDSSRWIVPFGSSGRPGDRHFADQLPQWMDGRLIGVPAGDPRPGAGGEPMEGIAYQERLVGLGTLRLVPLDPDQHLDLVYRWVTAPRAQFWGMTGYTREQVRDVYAFLAGLPTHHAYLLVLDGAPVGIFQTYQPEADPVGEVYPVQPGDVGIHLFLAPPRQRPVPGFTGAVAGALTRYVFGVLEATRIVVEPDVRNARALRRWRRLGFRFDAEVELSEKRAQLAFLPRPESGNDPAYRSQDVRNVGC